MEHESEVLLEEPQLINALFKYMVLQTDKVHLRDYLQMEDAQNVYQPDTNAIHRMLREYSHIVPNPIEICENLPSKKICLEPHEYLQKILKQNNQDNINSTAIALAAAEKKAQLDRLSAPIVNPFQEAQLLAQQIEGLNGQFAQGLVDRCDQDADLKELENRLSSENGHSTRDGNALGSSDNLSNAGNMNSHRDHANGSDLRCIQKRNRRPRADQIVKKVKEDTKNLLRNYGNAQTRFILSSVYSKRMMDSHFQNDQDKIEEFKKWVTQQKLENFEQFKNIWYVQDDESCKEYKQLFREICFDFYENHASVYVLSSQMRSEDTRKTHIKYICRFLDGIVNPNSFYYFKKN